MIINLTINKFKNNSILAIRLFFCCLFLLNTFTFISAQENTVGLLSYDGTKTFDGFNLIYPHNQPNTYLLNNCGEVVHTWAGEEGFRPANVAYIQENGNLIRAKRSAVIAGDSIWAGGGGAIVEELTWDGEQLWSFELNTNTERLHHDIAPLPNGNVLMVVWELKTEAEAIQAGRDPSTMAQNKLWPDKIIEYNPTTETIDWEWNTWDHLVQDFDETKDNFGVIAENPTKVNINYDSNDGHPDWMHVNSIDYDPFNGLIIISVPTFSEIWIINKNTTTEQAAGSAGDLLYRWGNRAAYNQGTAEDQKLFFQHDANFIDNFISPASPDFGKVMLFNNRVGADFSTVNVLNTGFDMYEFSFPMENNVFLPDDFDRTITHPQPTQMYSTGLSSAQLLPNGNTLICAGRFGYSFELTPENQVVWEYKTPLLGGQPATQGDTLVINNNLTFRMTRYPADFEGFEGQDLVGLEKQWLELEPNETYCDRLLPTSNIPDYKLNIYPNPANNHLVIEWEAGVYTEVEIFDILGRKRASYMASGGRKYLMINEWEAGVYFIQINGLVVEKLIVGK